MNNLSMPSAGGPAVGLSAGSGVKPHERRRFILMVLITINAL
ncbi:MAG: hypothetical protein RLZZ133_1625 [Pseudomonadota bacterium]